MEIITGLRLSHEEVISLLKHFDDSSDTPLHIGVDFVSYGKKLSDYAHFVIAFEDCNKIGFIAYYLNDEKQFAYIPQTVVHKTGRHKGIGHAMFEALYKILGKDCPIIHLEVLKENWTARKFYNREGFFEIEDHNERLLLEKKI